MPNDRRSSPINAALADRFKGDDPMKVRTQEQMDAEAERKTSKAPQPPPVKAPE